MTEFTHCMFLSREEIVALTTRVRKSAQVRALRAMGIEHRIRPDGSVAILRAHVEQIFGGTSEGKSRKPTEPNWGALHAKTA